MELGEDQEGAQGRDGGGGAGQVKMRDFSFKMQANKASPKLFLHCATGKAIKEAILTCRRASGKQEEYLRIKMSDVIVSSYRTGNADADRVFDDVTLNFVKIRISHIPIAGAEVVHEYNCATRESS